MQPYLTEILGRIKDGQEKNYPNVCPRCGENTLELSQRYICRHTDAQILICRGCATDEALRDCEPEKRMRLTEWAAVKKELAGKTFLDLLCSGRELDCDLIIGGTEMPASFVWDSGSALTVFGTIFYAALLESPYEELPNGNIEIFCDDYHLGEHFTLAAAGSIALSEYRKLFGHMEFTRDDIAIDGELDAGEIGITACFETRFDVEEKFGVETGDNDDVSLNFYAAYRPDLKRLRCYFYIVGDGEQSDADRYYYPTVRETELIIYMMEEACRKENGCDLLALWRRKDGNGDPEQNPVWLVTDDSCWQCCREVSEKVFELIQVCNLDICKAGERYAIARHTVNLDDYTVEQWEDYAELFGHDGLHGFISDYDKTFPMRILAEYIFETNWLCHLLEETYDTFDDAARYIAGVVDCVISEEGVTND